MKKYRVQLMWTEIYESETPIEADNKEVAINKAFQLMENAELINSDSYFTDSIVEEIK